MHFLKFSYGGLIAAMISFISVPIVAGLIIPDEFGRAAMYILAYNLLINTGSLGTDQSFVRNFYSEEYKTKRNVLLWESMLPSILGAFVIIVVLTLSWRSISLLLIGKESEELIAILSTAIFFGIIEKFSLLLIRMSQKANLFSILRILQSLITATVTISYAFIIDRTYLSVVYGSFASAIIISILAMSLERKYLTIERGSIRKTQIVKLLRYGVPFVPTFVALWVFQGMDKVGLRYFADFAEIGIYSVAFKIVAVLTILQTTFTNFWTPIAYEVYENKSENAKLLFEKVFQCMSLVLVFAGILIITIKNLIILVFDNDYQVAAQVVSFLLFIPIMYTLSEITVGGINFMKKTKWHFIISMIVVIVNGIGILILVPKWGAVGAAFSTAIAYIVFFYLRTLIALKYYPLKLKLEKISLSLVVFFITALVNSFYSFYGITLFNLISLLSIFLLNFNIIRWAYCDGVKLLTQK